MTKKQSKPVLGRGLSALISKPVVSISSYRETYEYRENSESRRESQGAGAAVPVFTQAAPVLVQDSQPVIAPVNFEQELGGDKVLFVPVHSIVANPAQPRKSFDEAEIKELSESIKNMGVLQPIIVRPAKSGADAEYEIVAGERRWRASQVAQLEQVPVIVKELSDWESLEIALVENVQRSELNHVDEAEAYQRLMDQYSLTQQDVADRIGKDRATVANIIRLLKLPSEALKLVRSGKLNLGQAKAILSLRDPAAQSSLAKKVADEGLSVRAVENLVSQGLVLDGQVQPAHKGKEKGITGAKSVAMSFPDVLDRLRKALGTKVLIRHHKSGRGKIEIEYFSEAELDRLIDKLCD